MEKTKMMFCKWMLVVDVNGVDVELCLCGCEGCVYECVEEDEGVDGGGGGA